MRLWALFSLWSGYTYMCVCIYSAYWLSAWLPWLLCTCCTLIIIYVCWVSLVAYVPGLNSDELIFSEIAGFYICFISLRLLGLYICFLTSEFAGYTNLLSSLSKKMSVYMLYITYPEPQWWLQNLIRRERKKRCDCKSDNLKAYWTMFNNTLFIDLVLEQKQKGNRSDKALNVLGWESMGRPLTRRHVSNMSCWSLRTCMTS